ncbi:MAG: DNA ligase D [Polaromonas sp.]|uniref:DNA ligase D n=1 Tax=Polaromonas sp. TaxID=1869339 RepID=UPI00272FD471|nr:DNA ligase D [Polaromonas sp.]MDP2451843.1 DNA ligase D [Polaromonas sp.]MDP3247513.1 DNA ligase D [Polaromonas sp.]
MAADDPLQAYRAKRDFKHTPEPAAGGRRSQARSFVVQKHDASQLHYDFRLELEGTLKSWAVPKGPSLDPGVKRMAVQVEDHPLSYASFEGTIPDKQYGAGNVIVWDRGTWLPAGDPVAGLQNGKLKFELQGEKLKGHWSLVRMHGKGGERQAPWLLIKDKDDAARPAADYDVLQALPDSVITGTPLAPRKRTAGKKAAPKPASTRSAAVGKKTATTPRLPPGAIRDDLPQTLAPELATLVTHLPTDSQDWVYEIKFDGYRLLTRMEGPAIRCFTRNGHDWSARLPALVEALSRLGLRSGWLDGEIVVHDKKGVPDFGALQNAFDSGSTAQIVYYVFDLPFYEGYDLRPLPLVERRNILRALVQAAAPGPVRFSETFEAGTQDLLAAAGRLGLEGVIGKRASSPYVSRRSPSWIKLKTQLRQEFVIGGYTDPKGSRAGLGALLLGVYDDQGALRYAGNVGTGFDDATLQSLQGRLAALATPRPAFAGLPASVKGHWVQPVLLAEVSFAQWTHTGRIRHAVFQGLRTDKDARKVSRESAQPIEDLMQMNKKPAASPGTAAARKRSTSRPAPDTGTLRVTHPERVVDPATGLTKLDLVHYYALVAPLILPHLRARPVALVRAPGGVQGELFFQKHAEATAIPGLKLLDPALDPGHAPLLEITTAKVLLAAAQLNVMEFHTWNATTRSIAKPDRMTFDLDPGEAVSWAQIREAAQLVHALLKELGLPAFLKTSGGKGLHVVVPLRPAFGWDTVKDFSQAIVQHLSAVIPERFVAKSGPRNRVGKIFPDYLRNGFGATTVCAWSVRARPGLGVSVPVGWAELDDLSGAAHWTAANIADRVAIGNSPWEGYEQARCALPAAMKALGFKVEKPVASPKPARARAVAKKAAKTGKAAKPDAAV